MKHLSRDLQTLTSSVCPGTNMYALAIFLANCGGFSQVGHTNFDITTSPFLIASNVSASINVVGAPKDVYIPTGSYSVSINDINRILVLKSNAHPKSNSGLFRILNFNSSNNTLSIDYRSSVSPPSEQSIRWAIYENELSASLTWRSGSNGLNGYGSYNTSQTSNASRVILKSPDASSWQVRMCLESTHDISGAVPSGFSIAPGFGGTSDGDFSIQPSSTSDGHDQKLYLHAAHWYNTTSSLYRGMTVGLSPCLEAKGQWRISMIVDDVNGTCGIINKNVNLPVPSSGSGWCVFGLPENEVGFPRNDGNAGNVALNIQRLFVVGSSNAQSNLTWTSQFHSQNNMQVVGWSRYGYPTPGVLSCYSDISNPGNTHFRYLTSSADTPWVSSTELLDVEILLGTIDQTSSPTNTTSSYKMSPVVIGSVPMFMQGRSNFTQWSTTNDVNSSYYHAIDGVFMEWGGPPPTDNGAGSSYVFNSVSSSQQQGLYMYHASLPGSNTFVPESTIELNTFDIDSMRYRKTYSYFRQPQITVGVIKGGSNPSKP